MQIEIDFEVFKALTARRMSEAESYNSVIRQLLQMPAQASELIEGENPDAPGWRGGGKPIMNAGARALFHGAYFGNVAFPEGTKFRATYKGQTYLAEIRGNKWIDADGMPRRSPSDAAGAISGTNVNGWRFWHVLRPGDPSWRRLDELK
jgi:hypothetical protein